MEGQVLLFLEHCLENRPEFPKVYTMYRLQRTNHICTVMQRLPGQPLSDLWPTLQPNEKSSICVKIKQFINSLRGIPHTNIYANVMGGPLSHYLFYSPDSGKEICGPFDTETGFITIVPAIASESRCSTYNVDIECPKPTQAMMPWPHSSTASLIERSKNRQQ